jgi:hypothetical protein
VQEELYRSDSLPPVEAWLRFGGELHRARLGSDYFIYRAIEQDSSLEAPYLRGMLFAAARLHNELLGAEDHARLGDQAHLRQTHAWMADPNRWPDIRPQLVRFANLCFEELAMRTPPLQAHTSSGSEDGPAAVLRDREARLREESEAQRQRADRIGVARERVAALSTLWGRFLDTPEEDCKARADRALALARGLETEGLLRRCLEGFTPGTDAPHHPDEHDARRFLAAVLRSALASDGATVAQQLRQALAQDEAFRAALRSAWRECRRHTVMQLQDDLARTAGCHGPELSPGAGAADHAGAPAEADAEAASGPIAGAGLTAKPPQGSTEAGQLVAGGDCNTADDPQLSDLAKAILQVLHRERATGPNRIMKTATVARKIAPDQKAATLKRPVAEMRDLGLIVTAEGPHGGIYLSVQGTNLAERLFGGRK